jgi:hypothetical protein
LEVKETSAAEKDGSLPNIGGALLATPRESPPTPLHALIVASLFQRVSELTADAYSPQGRVVYRPIFSSIPVEFLLYGNFSRLNFFCLREHQCEKTLIDASADFRGLYRRVKFVDAPEIVAPNLAMNGFTARLRVAPMTQDGQFSVLDGDFKACLVNPGHFSPNEIAFFGRLYIHRWSQILDLTVLLAGGALVCFTLRF